MFRHNLWGPAPRAVLTTTAILLAALSTTISAQPTQVDTPNEDGVLRTIATNGNTLDMNNPFFLPFGNGRSCGSCHVASAAWSITPDEIQQRFRRTNGLDPIFRLNDGANSPLANVRNRAQRKAAYSMLLSKGLIRVGLPIPANAEFELVKADDPYGFASARELSEAIR